MKDQIVKIAALLPKNINPLEALEGIKRVLELQLEMKKVDVQIKDLEVKEKVLMHEINRKYDFLHEVFTNVFSERKQAINKYFEIIDEGLKKNDNEMIALGLNNLGNVVTASPFSSISELTNIIKSGKTIEL